MGIRKDYMKIYLLDRERLITTEFEKWFCDQEDVSIVTDDFQHFMITHDVECIVSPANAFGLMDGGYDLAISQYFGDALQRKVQRKIISKYGGHQPLTTALTVNIDDKKKLIHVPTMLIPSRIKDPYIIYECMRATLFEAKRLNVKSIVIPAFGGLTGGVSPDVIAKLMWLGYAHFKAPNDEIDWSVAMSIADEFADIGVPVDF